LCEIGVDFWEKLRYESATLCGGSDLMRQLVGVPDLYAVAFLQMSDIPFVCKMF